jgi:hypothetical protein
MDEQSLSTKRRLKRLENLVGGGASPSGGGAAAVTEIRFLIGTGATQTSATPIPANAIVVDAELDTQSAGTTPYTAGTTIEIGSATSLALLQATTDNTPTSAGLYAVHQSTGWGGAGSKVTVTVAGAPVAGAAFVIVRYVETPQP